MPRKTVIILGLLVFWDVCLPGITLAQGVGRIEPINKNDRLLILAPHPDDETIGCAGVIQQALKAGAEVRVVYLTNGDHNEFAFIVYEKRITFRRAEFIHMGLVRRQEAIAAMRLLGLSQDKLTFLGYPDNGTLAIFNRYWQVKKPFRSLLTRISSVPYKTDLSFGAPYVGESILADLKKVIFDYKPTKIFVSHPADVNGDHRALYLFLQVALRDLGKQIPKTKVYPYLVHWSGWPLPRHYHPEISLEPPQNFRDSQVRWMGLALTPEQVERKRQAILCYRSQTRTSAFYLLAFARRNELFGYYPDIELSQQMSLKERVTEFFGSSRMFKLTSSGKWAFAHNKLIRGQEEVSYAILDNSLLIRIAKNEESNRTLSVMFYIFGASSKAPFASMPKIRIVTRYTKFRVYDGRKRINPAGLHLDLNPQELILRVPLSLLGNPDFILLSAKAYAKKIPAGATGFRKIVIK
jgi:LmbE family N-acetylglucosaminyl deacetylase